MAVRCACVIVFATSCVFHFGLSKSPCPDSAKKVVHVRSGNHISGSRLFLQADFTRSTYSEECILRNYDVRGKQVRVRKYYNKSDYHNNDIEFTINGTKGSDKKKYTVFRDEQIKLNKMTNKEASICLEFSVESPYTLYLFCKNPTMQVNGPKADETECSRRCQTPDSPNNGKIISFDFDNGCTEIKFECNKGYTLVGTAVFTCLINGHWSRKEFPKCIDKGSTTTVVSTADETLEGNTLNIIPIITVTASCSFIAGSLVMFCIIFIYKRRKRKKQKPDTCSNREYYNYLTPVYRRITSKIFYRINRSLKARDSKRASTDKDSVQYETINSNEISCTVSSSTSSCSYMTGRIWSNRNQGDTINQGNTHI